MGSSSVRSAAVVTGGTDGIGRGIAARLARAGCRVLIVGRDAEKGRGAESDLRTASANPRIEFLQADLGLMRDTRRLAAEIARRCPALSRLDPLLAVPVEDVAEAAVQLVTQPAVSTNGAYFQFIRKFKPIDAPATVRQTDLRLRLWRLSERLAAIR